jgi:hypothetical protein
VLYRIPVRTKLKISLFRKQNERRAKILDRFLQKLLHDFQVLFNVRFLVVQTWLLLKSQTSRMGGISASHLRAVEYSLPVLDLEFFSSCSRRSQRWGLSGIRIFGYHPSEKMYRRSNTIHGSPRNISSQLRWGSLHKKLSQSVAAVLALLILAKEEGIV